MRDAYAHSWVRLSRWGPRWFLLCAAATVATTAGANLPAILAGNECSALPYREEAACMEAKIGFFLLAYAFIGGLGLVTIASLALGLGDRQARRVAYAPTHAPLGLADMFTSSTASDLRHRYAGAAARVWFATICTVVFGILVVALGLLYVFEGGQDRLDFDWMASMVLSPTLVCLLAAILAWPGARKAFEDAQGLLSTGLAPMSVPAPTPRFTAYRPADPSPTSPPQAQGPRP